MAKIKSHNSSFLYIVQHNHINLAAKCQQMRSGVPEFVAEKRSVKTLLMPRKFANKRLPTRENYN